MRTFNSTVLFSLGALLLAGALFPAVGAIHDYAVVKDVEWVKVGDNSLTLDIYTPAAGKDSYPVLVIYHGGGWLINTNATMDSMAVYLVRRAEIVVCNVDFRLLGDFGNTVTMDQIIEDALGAVAWIREHIGAYQGNPAQLIVTGDSSGGHMAAMVLLCSDQLESDGFYGATLGFCPTYLPPGKSAEELAAAHALAVQGAILSYGAFDIYAACQAGMESSANIFWLLAGKTARGLFGSSYSWVQNPEMYKAVSPIHIIPPASRRLLPPQLCLVGSKDTTTPPASVQAYVDSVRKAGQQIEYWEYPGKPHAFLDAAPNFWLGTQFTRDAPPALGKMIDWMAVNHLTAIEKSATRPEPDFRLEQNYPNPFNGNTTIAYQIPRPAHVSLTLYNVLGQRVGTLVDARMNAGRHQVQLAAGSMPSGLYFYELKSESFSTRKYLHLAR